MIEAIVRVMDPDRHVPLQAVESWVRKLNMWGCNTLYLYAADVFRYRHFWDLYEYLADETDIENIYVFSMGQWVDSSKARDIYEAGIKFIVPIDFANPFADEMIGAQNYSAAANRLLQMYPDVTVWQTLISENTRQVQQYVELAGEHESIDWVGHSPPTGEYAPPSEDVVTWLQDHDFTIHGQERWLFVHRDVNMLMRFPGMYREEIVGSSAEMAGTIYVGTDGRLHPHRAYDVEADFALPSMERRDLREYAALHGQMWNSG